MPRLLLNQSAGLVNGRRWHTDTSSKWIQKGLVAHIFLYPREKVKRQSIVMEASRWAYWLVALCPVTIRKCLIWCRFVKDRNQHSANTNCTFYPRQYTVSQRRLVVALLLLFNALSLKLIFTSQIREQDVFKNYVAITRPSFTNDVSFRRVRVLTAFCPVYL